MNTLKIKKEMEKICINCKHLNALSGGCKAYPEGIPYEIGNGEKEHTEVNKDQQGKYIFEAGESHELDFLEDEK